MAKLNYKSDNAITLAGPVNLNLDTAVQTAAPVPTVTAKLYHERKEVRTVEFVTRLTLDEAISSTVINLPKFTPSVFEVGDTVVIDQDDGSVHETTISTFNLATGYDSLSIAAGLTKTAAAGSTLRLTKKGATSLILVIQSPGGPITLEKGDTIEIDLDSGIIGLSVDQVRTITAVEDADNLDPTVAPGQDTFECITLSSTLTGTVSAGRKVRRKLGADIAMTNFGTFPTSNPVLGDTSWGFRGTIADTHDDLEVGMTVRIEVIFNGGVGLQMVKALRANVVEDTS
jgi:hypothetical protein